MTDREKEQFHTILDRQDDAMGAFREAADAFDVAVEGMHTALAGMSAATKAQGRAMEALQTANRAAMELLNQKDDSK